VEDPARLPEMCEALLANPLIEDYEILARPEAERELGPRGGMPRGGDPGGPEAG